MLSFSHIKLKSMKEIILAVTLCIAIMFTYLTIYNHILGTIEGFKGNKESVPLWTIIGPIIVWSVFYYLNITL